ncbi:MAG: hypothetical protein KAV87_34040 [Desulfobacteraceae bacterium]|nr:hypothetical protein [Desulfobacteraceae bacterium]
MLRKLDPNRNGRLTRREVKTYYRLIKWNQLEKDFKAFYKSWRGIKRNSCQNYCFKTSCVSQTPLTKLARKVFPSEPTNLTVATVTSHLKSKRTEYETFTMRKFGVYHKPQGGGILYAELKFRRLHPIKSYKIILHGKDMIRVQITHYSGKKTRLVMKITDPRTAKFERGGNPTKAKLVRKRQTKEPNEW